MELYGFCGLPYFEQYQLIFIFGTEIIVILLIAVLRTRLICYAAADNGIVKRLPHSGSQIVVYLNKSFHSGSPYAISDADVTRFASAMFAPVT